MNRKRAISIISVIAAFALALGAVLITNAHVDKAKKMHDLIVAGLSDMSALIKDLKAESEEGGAPRMLSFARLNKERATEASDKIRKACDYYRKVHVPSSLKDELKAVRATLPELRSFADAFENLFGGVMTEDEFKEAALSVARRSQQLSSSDGFAQAEANFMIKLNRVKSRRRFIWLW